MKVLFRQAMHVLILAISFAPAAAFAQEWNPKPTKDIDEGADKNRVPVIFVHGSSGCGEQFERSAMHFTSNGYPPSWVVAYDYRAASYEELSQFIDELIAQTGHKKVNLVGAAAGAALTSQYLRTPAFAEKIAHWAVLASGIANNPNGVPSIAISGVGVNGVGPQASNGGVAVAMPEGQDQVGVTTSDECFAALFTFFNDGEQPKSMKFEPQAEPQVVGWVKAHLTNVPCEGAVAEVWEVAKETGRRNKDKPLVTLTADAKGKLPAFRAQPGQHYEFLIRDKAAAQPRHIYREPFNHSDALVYFRVTASAPNYGQSPFDKSPKYLTDKSAVFCVRHQNGSLLMGQVSLKVNGAELIAEPMFRLPNGPRQNPVVALYLADGNENGKSDYVPCDDSAFRAAFGVGADVFIPADSNTSVKFQLNERELNVPAWKGSEAGQINVIFDDFK